MLFNGNVNSMFNVNLLPMIREPRHVNLDNNVIYWNLSFKSFGINIFKKLKSIVFYGCALYNIDECLKNIIYAHKCISKRF